VLCNNKDKGALATKACKMSCIGCGKCVKVCEKFEAISVNNNVAYIDAEKCKMCRKCEEVCPRGAIKAINFPPRKPKAESPTPPNASPMTLATNFTPEVSAPTSKQLESQNQ
jgi:ferredoxin